MPLTLDNPLSVQAVATQIEINSWSVDHENFTIHIVYDTKTEAGEIVQADQVVLIEGQADLGTAFYDVSVAASQNGGDVYAALKTVLYAAVTAAAGLTGTLV